MDYHREILADPISHGMKVDRFNASDGTPIIVCSPDASGRIGGRGTTIRDQLGKRKVLLPPAGSIRGTLVLVHGRKGRKEDYLPIAERLCAVGFRCVIPDMPAHGENMKPFVTYGVSEAGIPARALDEAAARFHFDKQPAGLLGMSMGGSISVHAAALPDAPWRALGVISSFDTLSNAFAGQTSHYVGSLAGPLLAHAADGIYQHRTGISVGSIRPCEKAATIRIPTLIAHGSKDTVATLECGKRLYDCFTNAPTKKWIEVPDATHDNVFITDYPIYADIAEWMLTHVAPAR